MQKKKVREIAFKTMQKTLKNDSKTEQESTLHRRAKKTSKNNEKRAPKRFKIESKRHKKRCKKTSEILMRFLDRLVREFYVKVGGVAVEAEPVELKLRFSSRISHARLPR